MTESNFRKRIQKTYTKKDLEKALGLKNKAQLQKRIDKLVDIYKIDMKKFQKNSGESERAAYSFNGIAFDTLCVLLNNMSDDKLPKAITDEDVGLRKDSIENIDITQYAHFIKSIKKDIDKIEFKPLRLHIHAQKAYQDVKKVFDSGNKINEKLQLASEVMNQLPIDKQVELSDKIAFAIHETIYSTFAENKYNERIVEQNQTSENSSQYDFRFNYFVNQLTDNVITEDINEDKAFIYDNDEQLDWLLVNILNTVQRAADGWGMRNAKPHHRTQNFRDIEHYFLRDVSKMIDKELNKQKNLSKQTKKYDFDNKIEVINNNIDKFNEDDQIGKHLLELRKRLDFHSAAILDKKNRTDVDNEMFQYFMDDMQQVVTLVDRYINKPQHYNKMKNGYINEYKTFYDEYINEVNAPQTDEKNMPMALLMKQFKDKLLRRRNRHKKPK
ncbi:DUF6038 family protein [Staphylococcus equorum]|uniref:Uncharacterized protein n=1 Tax=Staphylococcus equorum TaxID=246432 RepID=A0AAP7LUA3_9STAP|nr:DUF6038 family protein [Staphylococcus equorum]MDK9863573.1 DUF6038 family protein [Staphylococcus equorum]OEK52914.1 hypothetical protein ASS97_12130 [Staphylococcus equorum]OEK58189.1 hypothetical protein ASS94_04625 [Staphylococcus equorum]OEK61752.1 hypothetical protein ASS99_09025 [Staphylococcus equorum]OEK63270.1 hypothetical protein ASS98_05515 [Staphylococcus equorum]